MKRKIILSLFTLILALVSTVWGTPYGMITYTPDAANLTIPEGSSGTVFVNLDIINADLTSYYVKVAPTMVDGNLPLSWIQAAPAVKFMTSGTPLSTAITVSVPSGTLSGTYSGHLTSSAKAVHGNADPGTGILITITVPPVCGGIPVFTIDSYDPAVLWPPDHSIDTVTVRGMIGLPTGCSLLEAGYSIDDEYGIYTSINTFTSSSDGTFAIALPLEASRTGNDKDGRYYNISLYARDEVGISSSPTLTVIVPHDQRKGRNCKDYDDREEHHEHERHHDHDDDKR